MREPLQSRLVLSLSKDEASGTAAGPALSFDKLGMRTYFDRSLSLESGR